MAEQLHSSFRCPLTLLTAQREKTSLIYGDQHVALDLRSLYIACVYMKWGRCLLAPKKMEAVQDPNSFFLFSSDPMAPCTTFDKDLKSALVSYVGPSAGFLTMTALRKSVITAVRTLQNRSPAVNSMLDKETLAWHQGHTAFVVNKHYAPTAFLETLAYENCQPEEVQALDAAVTQHQAATRLANRLVGMPAAKRAQAALLANTAYKLLLRQPAHYYSINGCRLVVR